MPARRRTIHYSGQVQGVGFRWRTTRVLQALEVRGYVKNLSDGRVELVIEGDTLALDEALTRVREQLCPYIRRESCEDSSPTGEFQEFGIRR